MARDDIQLREQLAKAEERLSSLHHAVSDAVDRLSQLYNSMQTGADAHDEEYVSGVKTRYIRAVHHIAKDLAFALAQQEV
jgi:hypothetical protein